MADNIAITAGSGTTISTDELAGSVHIQRTKTTFGVGGTATDVSSSDPLPVVATNGGTFATQVDGAALTALQLIDDTVYTDDTSTHATGTSKGVGIMAAATPTDTSVSANDIGMVAMSTARALHTAPQSLPVSFDTGAADATTLRMVVADDQFQAAGPLAKAASTSVTIATDEGGEYETVAASQTAQAMGTGATGDFIEGVLVVPATTSPGNVLLLDNATSITIFTGGADSVSNLVPFYIPLGMRSVSGAWKITTGTNVSAIGIGTFT